MNKVIKAVLPKSYTLNTMEKPMHAGEIYQLWEGLSTGYESISLAETFQMNTNDKELHKVLQSFLTDIKQLRIERIEKLLKDAGFTVPPRPAPKTLQGKPGVGQEVKLGDEEVIKIMTNFMTGVLNQDGIGIGTVTTNKKIRSIFIDLLNNDIGTYETFFNIGKKRQALEIAPPATSAPDSLTMGEVNWLWTEINYRHLSIHELVTFLNNTKDQELIDEIQYGLNKVSGPELKEIEDILKREGFTVPARPVDRTTQQTEGRSNRIFLKDIEIISLLLSAAQVAVTSHISALVSASRGDIMKLYKRFLLIEIDNMEKLLKLAIKRNLLLKPPFVTSKRG